jgi:hypothetical protein
LTANPPMAEPISPDLPELRLLAQLASIKPSALAAALNNPECFSKHISNEELQGFLASMTRASRLIVRITAIIVGEANRAHRAHRALTSKGRCR